MKEKSQLKIGNRGYAAEACRIIGVTRTVYETAKKKVKSGGVLTKNELKVLLKYKELIRQAEDDLKKL